MVPWPGMSAPGIGGTVPCLMVGNYRARVGRNTSSLCDSPVRYPAAPYA
jgi:hypothetical protein